MASMGSDDTKPKSLMSRNKGDNKVITGGRSIKHLKTNWGSSTSATWLSNPDRDLDPDVSDDDERPKAKKPMFKHVPREVSASKLPAHPGIPQNPATDPGNNRFKHSRAYHGKREPHGGWNYQHTRQAVDPLRTARTMLAIRAAQPT